jgi:hypothetical protein
MAPLPEVRQCTNTDNPQFGATAVNAGNRWGVMHPQHGGHWATNARRGRLARPDASRC